MTDDEARAFLADVSDGRLLEPGHWSQIAIAGASNGDLLGDIGLFVSADATEAEIGISLRRAAQGQGFAGESAHAAIALVFAHTAVDRVLGITDVRNQPSIRLLDRIGMRRIGEQDSMLKGENCRELIFAVARGDWAAATGSRGEH